MACVVLQARVSMWWVTRPLPAVSEFYEKGRIAMMTGRYLLALALAGQLTTARAAAAPCCPGPPPPPQECMRVVCIVGDQSWDYVPLRAGTSCRQGTGQCDGEGTCLVPPVPASVLAGLFLGTIQADGGSSARI